MAEDEEADGKDSKKMGCGMVMKVYSCEVKDDGGYLGRENLKSREGMGRNVMHRMAGGSPL